MANETTRAQEFIQTLEDDTSLQAQFAVASPTDASGIVDFASARGYVFTKEDLESALNQLADSTLVDQLRQSVGSQRIENGFLRNFFSRHVGFKLPQPQPSRLM